MARPHTDNLVVLRSSGGVTFVTKSVFYCSFLHFFATLLAFMEHQLHTLPRMPPATMNVVVSTAPPKDSADCLKPFHFPIDPSEAPNKLVSLAFDGELVFGDDTFLRTNLYISSHHHAHGGFVCSGSYLATFALCIFHHLEGQTEEKKTRRDLLKTPKASNSTSCRRSTLLRYCEWWRSEQ